MAFEIIISLGQGQDSTSSGTINLPLADAIRLFEADASTLEPGMIATLFDLPSGDVLRQVTK